MDVSSCRFFLFLFFFFSRWLRLENDPPCEWNEECLEMGAANGHLHVVRWAREVADPPCPWKPQEILDNYSGDLDPKMEAWIRQKLAEEKAARKKAKKKAKKKGKQPKVSDHRRAFGGGGGSAASGK